MAPAAPLDHDHFRPFRPEMINVIIAFLLMRDLTENRVTLFLIAH
jgi:hypothetical protein